MYLKQRKREPMIAATCYAGSAERCGDSWQWAELTDGRFAVALSDGMGKGEPAARESSKAVNAMIALLKAGMDPEMALQILNLLWTVNNRKELFPTMDLALLDPDSRELVIYKIGAAPTLIVRAPRCRPGKKSGTRQPVNQPGKSCSGWPAAERPGPAGTFPPKLIEILTAPAMPMGVSEKSEIPSISTMVMPGDLILMMTDGVADSIKNTTGLYPGLDWMHRLLTGIKSRNLQTICDLIIREAGLNYGAREKDDMAVVALRA